MKATYTCVFKTKAEAAANVKPVTVPPQTNPSAYGAQQTLVNTVLHGTSAAYGELWGPNGLIRRVYNPAGT